MSQTNWEADKMLDVYIHDYLVKRGHKATAQAFQDEGKVSSDPVWIDAPGGFLFEWWSVFWDIFIARTNEKHSEAAASYYETQMLKAKEQRREANHLLNGNGNNGKVGGDPLMRQNPATASAMATKMYEQRLKPPLPRDDSAIKQRFREQQLLDSNHTSILKSAAASGQPSGHGTAGGMASQVPTRNQQLPGWPLTVTGLDQLKSRLLQQQKVLALHHQQQLMIAQQNLTSPSAANDENRRLRTLLNNLAPNPVGGLVPNVGSPLQGGPLHDTEMLMQLKFAQLQQQQQLQQNSSMQQQQHSLSNQPSQNANLHQQDKMVGVYMDGSMSNTFRGNDQADMDRFVEDDDNVESFLFPDDAADPRDSAGRCMDVNKGFNFSELHSARASTSKVVCCHFSSDGKLLATGGHDKKAMLWHADSLKLKSTLEEHSSIITDVRFSPSMPRLATSSFDMTVRVWDADNPGYSLRTFMGHSSIVMSLDFHPIKDDLICSCDGDGEIRYWSINNGSCSRVFKGGMAQMRFQPHLGRYLAAAAENVVSILDVETQACRQTLQGHTKPIHSVCWDSNGELLASVSEDYVRVWAVGSGSEGECVHELSCNGNKFLSCVFHPSHPSLLVIGCYQSMELWNMSENKIMSLPAHDGLVAALAASNITGLVASASHDKTVKLWKS